MNNSYQNLNELIALIDEPNKTAVQKLYDDHKIIINKAPGGKTKHQNWEGGYVDHMTEICNIAITIYDNFKTKREWQFSISDAILTLLLHDLEKPWKYAGNTEELRELRSYKK